MTTQDLSRPDNDRFEIKPLRTAPAPGGGRKGGARGWLGALLLLAVLGLGLALWLHRHQPTTSAARPGPDEPLRIHGSNTIGAKLMPKLVQAFLKSQGYDPIKIEPGDRPNVTYVTGQSRNGERRVEIVSEGSETGFPDLAAGSADIGMSSDTITAAQASQLHQLGDLSSRLGEHVIGLDGVAVIVHKLNPVSDLTLRQLADIFSGAITDWSQAGGTAGPIKLYRRDDNSGTWAIFNHDVLQAFGKSAAPQAARFTSSQELSDAVAQDPQAIGLIGAAYVGTNKALGLYEEGVEPRGPAPCTLKTEEYLITRRLYLYSATSPSPEVAHFIEFATGAAAWPIVKEEGFVNLDPSPLPACDSSAQTQHTAEYLKATQHAQRFLTNFHFRPRSLEPDNKAYQSIEYLDKLLSSGAYPGHKLLLIGYADDGLNPQDNIKRSLQEANALRTQLAGQFRRRGLNVQIDTKGLGAQELLAPLDTPAGLEKNRRVEIWLH